MSNSASANSFRAALVQMRSGRDVEKNVKDAISLIRDAAAAGAHYIQTPECTTLMELDRERLMSVTQPEKSNAALAAFTDTARDLKVWLHIGSMGVAVDGGKLANRSYLIAPDGNVAARYDKIHMFDVDLANGDVYRESESYAAGSRAVLAELPWGGLGLTICYDLRFPGLHRVLAQGGAKFIAVPAAFTKETGIAHWHTLLRARAVETQTFVFAAGQGGLHENGRETFGHSLIISPWGQVLAEGGIDPRVIAADVDVSMIDDIRRRLPSLEHDRAFELVKSGSGKDRT
jgi:deaminated glutathione amidase